MKKKIIPTEGSPKDQITNYELDLVACLQHIGKTLMMPLPSNLSIVEYLKMILTINENNLKTLIPEGTK